MFNPATYMVSKKHFFIFSNLGSFWAILVIQGHFWKNMEYFQHCGHNLLLALYLPCPCFDYHSSRTESFRNQAAHWNLCTLEMWTRLFFFSTGYSNNVFHISIADQTFALCFALYLLCPYFQPSSMESFESLKFKKGCRLPSLSL